MDQVVLKIVAYSDALREIQAIRHTVFQVEQGVDSTLDFDGQDARATHIVAYLEGEPIGTARIRYLSDEIAKVERVAVLPPYRGQKIGRLIMEKAVDFLTKKGIPVIKINAQIQAKGFYEKLGFQQWGKEFDEAGISHVEMRLEKPIPLS